MPRQASLKRYTDKRNLSRSPEPAPGKRTRKKRKSLSFVVQKHDATTLHYDFRLEVGGVLVSWALPKGPPLEADDRRLAVRVEDHPLEYGKFEGVIPEGEYGAGAVLLWDTGTYENLRAAKEKHPMTMEASLNDGLVEISLQGKKLEGTFALKRFKEEHGKEQWLMLRMKKGGVAQPGLLEECAESVKTGRTLEEIGTEGNE